MVRIILAFSFFMALMSFFLVECLPAPRPEPAFIKMIQAQAEQKVIKDYMTENGFCPCCGRAFLKPSGTIKPITRSVQ